MSGNITPAKITETQIIKLEINQVLNPVIWIPLENIVARIKETKVVTKAIPPLSVGKYFIDILRIKGPSKNSANEKIRTPAINPLKFRENPLSKTDATIKPIALPIIFKTRVIIKRIILLAYFLNYKPKICCFLASNSA